MKLSPEEKAKNLEERRRIRWNEKHKIENGITYKWCDIANHWEVMDDEHFYKNDKNGMDGYSNNCKFHDNEKSKKNQSENKERAKVSQKAWKNQHREWLHEDNKRWRATVQDHLSEYQAAWRRTEFGKARNKVYGQKRKLKKHKISKKEWQSCKDFFVNEHGECVCAYCGMPLNIHYKEFGTDFHKDHKDSNGSIYLDNCIPACKSCNCSKWEFSFEEWFNENNWRFTQERLDKINQWIHIEYLRYITPKHLKQLQLII